MSAFQQWAPCPPLPIEQPVTPKLLARYQREYDRAHAQSLKLAERRASLPPGTSRARIATTNAKWSIAAEHRDRLAERLETAKRMLAEGNAG